MTGRIGAFASKARAAGALALILAIVAPSAARATSQASLLLIDEAGPPTISVGVGGQGFGSSEVVDMAFDATPVGTSRTGPGGRFSAWVEVPASAEVGVHAIRARGRTSGILASAAFTVRIDWPMFHATPNRRGYNPYETILGPGKVSGLVPAWTAPTSDIVNVSPVVVDGVVYASAAPDVYALDAATGEEIWVLDLPDYYGNTFLAVAYGRVYVTSSGEAELLALDATSGKQLWAYQAGGSIFSEPAVDRGLVYFGANDGHTYAVNAFTGDLAWRSRAGDGTPAVADGVVYAVTEDIVVKLTSLDARDGTVLWSTGVLRVGSAYGPVIAGGTAYVATTGSGGALYAREAATGAELWTAATPESLQSTPAVAYGRVYVGSNDNNLYAFDARTGEVLWTAPTGDAVITAPAVANGVVYAGSQDNRLHAFDAAAGAELWAGQAQGYMVDPAVVDGSVYVGSFDEHVYAFRLPGSSPR